MQTCYRPYIEDDLDRCAALAAEAWPVASAIAGDIHSLMIAYVKLSLLFSDYSEVCCTDDQVVGFLFGRTDKKFLSLRERFEFNKVSWGFLTGRYGTCKRRLRFGVSFIQTLTKVEFYGRRFDSEVELFVVGQEHRGQGIGQSLMNRFTGHLKQKNRKTLFVYTNMESNWTFYERYGFTKHRDFHDNNLSFLRGSKTCGYLYYYKLQ
ncbi:MAG: GNAT family N-acetyltransferase [Phycisphaerales bacterium]|nr:MAG: GNAT family N-acetyltransferase [Phycisphaerales bacterium]